MQHIPENLARRKPLKILVAPHPMLTMTAEPVIAVDQEVRNLIDDMTMTMYLNKGIGLAANQIGTLRRVVVIDNTRPGDPTHCIGMVNPVILKTSIEEEIRREGCLSFPGYFSEVTRPSGCIVSFLDRAGEPQEMWFTGIVSTCIQHEVDHLDGKLFIEHLSRQQRRDIMRRITR